jgi:hypothetical protein
MDCPRARGEAPSPISCCPADSRLPAARGGCLTSSRGRPDRRRRACRPRGWPRSWPRGRPVGAWMLRPARIIGQLVAPGNEGIWPTKLRVGERASVARPEAVARRPLRTAVARRPLRRPLPGGASQAGGGTQAAARGRRRPRRLRPRWSTQGHGDRRPTENLSTHIPAQARESTACCRRLSRRARNRQDRGHAEPGLAGPPDPIRPP